MKKLDVHALAHNAVEGNTKVMTGTDMLIERKRKADEALVKAQAEADSATKAVEKLEKVADKTKATIVENRDDDAEEIKAAGSDLAASQAAKA